MYEKIRGDTHLNHILDSTASLHALALSVYNGTDLWALAQLQIEVPQLSFTTFRIISIYIVEMLAR